MTPSLTFQWPLSPSGTFQPLRSLPLKSDVAPAGGDGSACRVTANPSPHTRTVRVRKRTITDLLPQDSLHALARHQGRRPGNLEGTARPPRDKSPVAA